MKQSLTQLRSSFVLLPFALVSLVTISLVSSYDVRSGRNLPWEAALILTPSGYLSHAIAQIYPKEQAFEHILSMKAKPRVSQSVEFPASLSYFAIYMQSNFLECVAFALLYHFLSKNKVKTRRTVLVTTLSNSITHPIVFFGFMASGISYFWAVLLAEAFAVGTETALHKCALRKKLSWPHVFTASFLANFASWQLGPVLTKTWLNFLI